MQYIKAKIHTLCLSYETTKDANVIEIRKSEDTNMRREQFEGMIKETQFSK